MELAQDRDQPLLMDHPVFGAQWRTSAQVLQDVVHPGHGQARMQRLALFAVRVQILRQLADAGLVRRARSRERKGFEAAGLGVARVVADTEAGTGCQSPIDVDATGEDAQRPGVIQGDGDQHVVGQHRLIQEDEGPVLGGLDGGDVARQSGQIAA